MEGDEDKSIKDIKKRKRMSGELRNKVGKAIKIIMGQVEEGKIPGEMGGYGRAYFMKNGK